MLGSCNIDEPNFNVGDPAFHRHKFSIWSVGPMICYFPTCYLSKYIDMLIRLDTVSVVSYCLDWIDRVWKRSAEIYTVDLVPACMFCTMTWSWREIRIIEQVTGELPSQRLHSAQSWCFVVCINKLLSKHSIWRWFETPWCPRDVTVMHCVFSHFTSMNK